MIIYACECDILADTRTNCLSLLIAEGWLAEDPAAAGLLLLLLQPVVMTGHSSLLLLEHYCSAHRRAHWGYTDHKANQGSGFLALPRSILYKMSLSYLVHPLID